MNGKEKRIIALDYSSQEEALALVGVLGEEAAYYKVGMELFYSSGGDIVRHLKAAGKKVFLDLKLHDIPNTAAKGLGALTRLGADMLNVHASGGLEMMRRAGEVVHQDFVAAECHQRILHRGEQRGIAGHRPRIERDRQVECGPAAMVVAPVGDARAPLPRVGADRHAPEQRGP